MSNVHLPHDHGENLDQLISGLPQNEDFKLAADIFHQLGDSSRLRIFWLLCHCEECVINLSAIMEMSSPAVSHHLKQLKSSGLITCRRDGKEVYYKAAENDRAKLLHNMIEALVCVTCPPGCFLTEQK